MRSTAHRCQIIASVRHRLAENADRLVSLARNPQRINDVETVASELIPLADALGWIGRRGANTLRDRRVGFSGRPVWMFGVRSVVQRVPLGRVLVLGTWNYPIFLSGVQIAQGLAAGNSVWIKPAPGSEDVTAALVSFFHQSGVPKENLQILDSSPEAAKQAIAGQGDEAVDLVVLTGSASTGKKVLRQSAETITPCIMELSGVDAVVALPGADWNRVVAAINFGLMLNSGATCIGPRRLMFEVGSDGANPTQLDDWIHSLRNTSELEIHPAARNNVADVIEKAMLDGCVDQVGKFDADRLRESGIMFPVVLSRIPDRHPLLQSDLFAPVVSLIPLTRIDDAVSLINNSAYRLAASVFGPPNESQRLAERLEVGCVTVNDLIAPTADPRLPFGGRGESGFGVTRGPEGLLAMTAPRVIATRTGRIAPHLSKRNDTDADLLTGALQLKHAKGFRARFAAVRRLATAAKRGKPVD